MSALVFLGVAVLVSLVGIVHHGVADPAADVARVGHRRVPARDEGARRPRTSRRPPPRRPRQPEALSVARDLAIDLGTANTLVYAKGQGIVLNEPSVIALNQQTGDVLAMGHEAWQMIGRTPGYIVAVRPLRQGAITDFDITQRMIRLLLQRAGVSRFNRPRVVICVPSAITEVERRAVTEAARRAGAAEAQLIEQPMAAAIGAGLPINEPVANMVDRRRRRHVGDRAHLPRRRRRAAGGPGRVVRHRRRASRPTSGASTASPSASAPPRRSRSPSARPGRCRTR